MLSADTILKATGGRIITRGADSFAGISTDSRTVSSAEIFLALKGERHDGHDYLEGALSKSAGAIVGRERMSSVPPSARGKTIICVEDTLSALHDIARHLRAAFSGHVIGIVGSNGKTTTKELTASILERRCNVLKTPGNLNNHIGMPLSMTRLTPDTGAMVLEMGTNRPGDVETLCRIALPDSAVITNIGYEHLEGLGTLDKVRDAELEILPFVRRVVANGDDHFLMDGLRRSFRGEMLTFGIESAAGDVTAGEILFTSAGLRFTVSRGDASADLQTRLWGRANAYNCLAAAAMASALGFSLQEIKEGIEAFKGVAMRYEVLEYGGATIINDVYNANPSSVRESLGELSRMATGPQSRRAIAVLGDMFELGEHEVGHHESIGKWMSSLSVDLFIAAGPLMAKAAACFSGTAVCVSSSAEAGRYLSGALKAGDVVLIKGSRGMKMEQVMKTMEGLSPAPAGGGAADAV